MRRAGHSYADPWEPNNQNWPREPTVSDREKMVATADVRCKHETNVAGLWTAVDAAYQWRLIEEHAVALEDLRRSRVVRLQRAAEVLRQE